MIRNQQKNFRRTLLVIPYIVVLSLSDIVLNVNGSIENALPELLWSTIFGQISAGDVRTMVLSIKCIGAIFLFTLLFGDVISQWFETARPFVFTRVKNRKKWLLKKIIHVWSLSAVYTFLFLAALFLICAREVAAWRFDLNLIGTFAVLFGIFAPLLTSAALLVNWISIAQNSVMGLLLVLSGLLVFEVVGILWFDCGWNIILNPLCCNHELLRNPVLATEKIGSNLAYLAVISAYMTLEISRMDLW